MLIPPPPPPTTDEVKKRLRREFRTRRIALKADQPDAAQRAADAFASAELLAAIQVAAVYHAVGSEIDAAPVAALLHDRGIKIALPVVLAADASLVFRLRDAQAMVMDAAGTFTAPASAPLVRPDLVFVPLLAFDGQGGRLGQGGGFYDRTLAHLRAEGQVLAIGLAYSGQRSERLPMDKHDQILDGVLTEDGLIWFSKDK